MRIGVPTEVKNHEYRVGLVPASVAVLVDAGHSVLVQRGAGEGSGFVDDEYLEVGARLADGPQAVFDDSEMIVKVKEPLMNECEMMHEDQLLFTYLHLAPLRELTDALVERKITGVAYETIEDRKGSLPLLTPMSEVAGRMATLVGAYYQQRAYGGRGSLLSGVPGVPPGDVVIVGGGIVGLNAAKVALGIGARVSILDLNLDRLRFFDDTFHGMITTIVSNSHSVRTAAARADLLIGAVLVPGHSAPKLITRDMLSLMKPGAVLVDVAVDQGGCAETTRATTHSDPVYEVDGVLHYCVANMPGAVPRTSTVALNNATLPYALALANLGVERAAARDAGLKLGINTYAGYVTSAPVAESQDRPLTDIDSLLS